MKAECFGLKQKDKECRDATQTDPLDSERSTPSC